MSGLPGLEEAPTDADLQARIFDPIRDKEGLRVRRRGMRGCLHEQYEGRREGSTRPGPRPLPSEATVRLKLEHRERGDGPFD